MRKLLMFFNVFFGNSYGSGQTLHGIGLIALSCECTGKKCYGTAQLELGIRLCGIFDGFFQISHALTAVAPVVVISCNIIITQA